MHPDAPVRLLSDPSSSSLSVSLAVPLVVSATGIQNSGVLSPWAEHLGSASLFGVSHASYCSFGSSAFLIQTMAAIGVPSSLRRISADQQVLNFPASFIRAELPSNVYRRSLRMAASRLDSQVGGSHTTTAEGLSLCLHHLGHSLRHRRRRGTAPAPAGESATAALCLYGAVATALSSVPPSSCPTSTLHVCVTRAMDRSATSARVQPRTLFPTSWSSRWTLLRLARGSELAGGFQQGGTVLLCCRSYIVSHFKISRCGPS